MQVAANPIRTVHDGNHIVVDFQRFDRTHADTGYIRFFDQAVEDVGQRRMIVEITAIGTEVDAGQDDFLKPASTRRLASAITASGRRDFKAPRV